jgi:hypothetical protein
MVVHINSLQNLFTKKEPPWAGWLEAASTLVDE